MSKFNPIQPPFGWQESWTKYPHGYTIYEALMDWLKHVNDLTADVNDWNVFLQGFIETFDVKLKDEVTQLVQTWIDNGYIEVVISEAIQFRMDEVETLLDTTIQRLPTKNILDFGALSDYVSGVGGTDNTPFIQLALNAGGVIYFPAGQFYIGSTLEMKSNTVLYFDPQCSLLTSVDKVFNFGFGIHNVEVHGLQAFHIGVDDSTLFYVDGANTSYDANVRDILITKVNVQRYSWFGYFKNLRKSNIQHVHAYVENGVYYTAKSAEVNITNSFFVNLDTAPLAGTRGIVCEALGSLYPEGLVVSNTLIYQFERNIHVKDLYVGFFSKVYFDALRSGCLESIITRMIRTEQITISDSWFIRKGLEIGQPGYASPQEIRSQFTNLRFDAMDAGVAIHCYPWVHVLDFNNISVIGTNVGTLIAFRSDNQNNYLNINNLRTRYCASIIQLIGAGQFNTVSNIPNTDNLATPVYFEHAVNTRGVEMDPQAHYFTGVPQGWKTNATVDTLSNIVVSTGVYIARVRINEMNVTTPGDFVFNIVGGSTNPAVFSVAAAAGAAPDYFYISAGDKNVERLFMFRVRKAGSVTVRLTAAGTTGISFNGYHNFIEVVKVD